MAVGYAITQIAELQELKAEDALETHGYMGHVNCCGNCGHKEPWKDKCKWYHHMGTNDRHINYYGICDEWRSA